MGDEQGAEKGVWWVTANQGRPEVTLDNPCPHAKPASKCCQIPDDLCRRHRPGDPS